ncbi:SDR family oxidoreductase [Deltaproteobacteria bacterium]|nr:SDR family oxidoreductase [Deltaproteobacteria bacterium]
MEKIALVTGASQGIGREIALRLSARDVLVWVNYSRSQDKAESVVSEIISRGGKAKAIQADVSSESQIQEMLKEIADSCERLDYLVNNAGIETPQPFESYELDDWRRIIDVNLTGKFLVIKYAVPLLKRASKPRIVNVASRLAFKAFEEASAYCCSQAGIVMLTKCAALELAAHGIRVNAVCPGLTRTPLTIGLYPQDEWEKASKANPAGRVGEPSDTAGATLFLLSEDADYINGTYLLVEGGSMLF